MQNWDGLAKGLLRAEMAKRHLKAPDLAKSLSDLGIEVTPENLKNKIARGGFSATFFLQCLAAMEVKTLHLD